MLNKSRVILLPAWVPEAGVANTCMHKALEIRPLRRDSTQVQISCQLLQ